MGNWFIPMQYVTCEQRIFTRMFTVLLHTQGVRQKMFLGSGGSTHKKQQKICIEYAFISEFMLRIYRGNFVNVKEVKIPSLAVLQVAKYIKTAKQCA